MDRVEIYINGKAIAELKNATIHFEQDYYDAINSLGHIVYREMKEPMKATLQGDWYYYIYEGSNNEYS